MIVILKVYGIPKTEDAQFSIEILHDIKLPEPITPHQQMIQNFENLNGKRFVQIWVGIRDNIWST